MEILYFLESSTDSIFDIFIACGDVVISLVSGGMKLATGRARVEDDN